MAPQKKRKDVPTRASSRSKRARGASSAAAAAPAAEPVAPRLAAGGLALSFGSGDMSQLGLGREPRLMERKKPFPIPTLLETPLADLACGALHSVVVDADGRVWSWGCNDDRALGRPTKREQPGFVEEIVPGLVEAESLAGVRVARVWCGDCHTLALSEDGRLFCWGTYKDGQGTLGFDGSTKHQPVPREVPELAGQRVAMAAAGENHDLALAAASGRVYEWGDVRFGQRQSDRVKRTKLKPRPVLITAVPASGGRRRAVRMRAVFAAGFTSWAVAESGDVYAWGLNNYGQAGTGDKEALLRPTLCEPLAGLDVCKIAGGTNHTLFLTRDGRVFSCGNGSYGRLGHGNNEHLARPTEIAALSRLPADNRVVDISTGGSHSIATTKGGHCYLWGFGDTYHLGNAAERDENEPHLLQGQKLTARVLLADGGCQHSVVVMARDGVAQGAAPDLSAPAPPAAAAAAEPDLPDDEF